MCRKFRMKKIKRDQASSKQEENQGKHEGVKVVGLGDGSHHHLKARQAKTLCSISASFRGPLMRGSVRNDERSRWRRKKQENDAHDVTLLSIPPTSGGRETLKIKKFKKRLSGEDSSLPQGPRGWSRFFPLLFVMSMGLCGSDCLTHHGPLHHDLSLTAIQAPSTGEL